MEITDSNELELTCGLCSNEGQFFRFSHFLVHLNEFHAPLKIFACQFCSRAFASAGRLFSHDCAPFKKYFLLKRLHLKELHEATFPYEFRSLVCLECGLQVSIDDNPDPEQRKNFLLQLQHCFNLHNSKDFIHIAICMFDVSGSETARLSFLTNNKNLRCCLSECFLPIYFNEAVKVMQGKRTGEQKIIDYMNDDDMRKKEKKGLTHSTFYTKTEIDGVHDEYQCKICKAKLHPKARLAVLVHHIRDNHYTKKSSPGMPRTSFNAQVQFTKIELGNGSIQYQCKICQHLTKNNVKANALSQHFNDRHPELRLQASDTLVDRYLTKYANLLLDVDENSNENDTEKDIVVIDKDIHEVSNFSKEFGTCEAQIRIYFPPSEILYSAVPKGLELLDDEVYSCELCDIICSGVASACAHYNAAHKPNTNKPFDTTDKLQVTCLYNMSSDTKPAVKCIYCDSHLCSVMGAKLHLIEKHQTVFKIRPKGVGEFKETNSMLISVNAENVANSILIPTIDVKQEIEPSDYGTNNSEFMDESINLHSKIEQILHSANSEIEKNEAVSSKNDSTEQFILDGSLRSMFAAAVATPNELLESTPKSSFDNSDVIELSTISGSSTQSFSNSAVRSIRAKARKFRRFNAQEQFTVIPSNEGPRYQCKVCGHITKPYVSANTLSQHFSYRHPEMRANSLNLSKRKRYHENDSNVSETSIKAIALNGSPLSSSVRQNGSSKLDSMLEEQSGPVDGFDDVVFERLLKSPTIEEFERLERSKTVFPYFNIVVQTNARIASQLLGVLCSLFITSDSIEKREKIANFFGEILRSARANNVDVLENLSTNEINVDGFKKIVNELLKKSGY